MQRPERHLDGEPGEQDGGDRDLETARQALTVQLSEERQVGRALVGHEEEDADEHQRRPEDGEQDEPARRIGACRVADVLVAEPPDEQPHRHEDDLEGDEEEQGVTREERREGTGLDEEDAAQVGRA